MYSILKTLLLPPASLLLLLFLGLAWWRRPLGRALVLVAGLGLWLLSLPIVAALLMGPLEPYPALSAEDLSRPRAQAILVLAANRQTDAQEYGGDDLGDMTLERVRYGAWLHHRTGLPLYVSGTSPADPEPSLARLMAQVLEQEFRAPVAGIEARSADTWENARFTQALLEGSGIRRLYLVSHAWHLPRAARAFEQAGLEVIPAPTGFVHRDGYRLEPGDFLPSARALWRSYFACHEYLGWIWYRIREKMA